MAGPSIQTHKYRDYRTSELPHLYIAVIDARGLSSQKWSFIIHRLGSESKRTRKSNVKVEKREDGENKTLPSKKQCRVSESYPQKFNETESSSLGESGRTSIWANVVGGHDIQPWTCAVSPSHALCIISKIVTTILLSNCLWNHMRSMGESTIILARRPPWYGRLMNQEYF